MLDGSNDQKEPVGEMRRSRKSVDALEIPRMARNKPRRGNLDPLGIQDKNGSRRSILGARPIQTCRRGLGSLPGMAGIS
jgi:hypothetical protein